MEIENRNIYSRKLDENMMQCYTDYIMMAWKQKRKGGRFYAENARREGA